MRTPHLARWPFSSSMASLFSGSSVEITPSTRGLLRRSSVGLGSAPAYSAFPPAIRLQYHSPTWATSWLPPIWRSQW